MDIVISGIGMITPLGSTREQTWSNLLAGCSGIVFTGHGLEAPILGFSENGARSRTGDFALVAAQEALRHADGQAVIKWSGNFSALLFARRMKDAGVRTNVILAEAHTLPWGCRMAMPISAMPISPAR